MFKTINFRIRKCFNFRNIIKVSSTNSQWRAKLLALKGKIARGKSANYVVISTYTSFAMRDFQQILPSISENAILIADEAHNIGANLVREAFRRLTIDRRIALSATLQRVYDEEGTKEIETFFNDSFIFAKKKSATFQKERCTNFRHKHKQKAANDSKKSAAFCVFKGLLKTF